MSTFSKGDKVRCINARYSNGALIQGQDYDVAEGGDHLINDHVRLTNVPMTWRSDRFELPEHADPEDTTDAYVEPVTDEDIDSDSVAEAIEHLVEPEPLKEGDWCLIWAQVARRNDDSGEFEHLIREVDGSSLGSYHLWQVHPDAIVRPDAGQVPPWVKPTRCTSLLAVEDGERLLRCARDEHGAEVYHWNDAVETWADAEAYGRVEVSS